MASSHIGRMRLHTYDETQKTKLLDDSHDVAFPVSPTHFLLLLLLWLWIEWAKTNMVSSISVWLLTDFSQSDIRRRWYYAISTLGQRVFSFLCVVDVLNVDVIADLILMEHFSDYRWMSPPFVKAISIASTTPNAWTVSVSAATVSSLKEPLASMSTNAPNRLADPTLFAPIWPAVIVANAKPVSSANPQQPRAKVWK